MSQTTGPQRGHTSCFGIISPGVDQLRAPEAELSGGSGPLDADIGSNTTAHHASPRSDEPLSEPIHPRLPKLARSVSMPLNTHLGYLQSPTHPPRGVQSSSLDEISRELSDSVQAMVQTLLHLSPPHILDPVKELFSACTVQLPTPSVSALLTTMKNLNYLSANLKALAPEAISTALHDDSLAKEGDIVLDNFDIGEVVQSVGDVLGGLAAQAGVDLAIFHGDVGMRHIDVIGDEQCILFILTHVRAPVREGPPLQADTVPCKFRSRDKYLPQLDPVMQ